MSRLQRFLRTVASSYVVTFSTMLYQLGSVPLALYYLSKEEFGLWVLMTQISAYLTLMELGMANSVARKLIDHKDERDAGEYGSLLQTGWWVLAGQGVIVLIIGFSLGSWLATFLRIPGSLRTDFTLLLYWSCALQALAFTTRAVPQVLYAHQRYDVVNWVQVAQQPLSLGVLWVGFYAHQGVYSFLWPLLVSWIFGTIALVASCVRMGLFPRRGAWGRPTWAKFRTLFDFGKDAFLVSVGLQLVLASQTFIITRNLGLTVAATWSVCTKALALFNQIIWRIADFSVPGFSEMVVRGEQERVRTRFRDLVIISGSIVGLTGILFALCNQSFVSVWTRGKISWPVVNDVLLACWMMIFALARCHCAFVPATGEIGFMRYVYFMEGFAFVLLASFGSRAAGIPAIIATSIVSTICFSGLYGAWHTAKYCRFPLREVIVDWQRPLLKIVLMLGPVAIFVWWISQPLLPMVRLTTSGLLVGMPGFYLLLRYGVPRALQADVYRYLPAKVQPVFRRIFAWG